MFLWLLTCSWTCQTKYYNIYICWYSINEHPQREKMYIEKMFAKDVKKMFAKPNVWFSETNQVKLDCLTNLYGLLKITYFLLNQIQRSSNIKFCLLNQIVTPVKEIFSLLNGIFGSRKIRPMFLVVSTKPIDEHWSQVAKHIFHLPIVNFLEHHMLYGPTCHKEFSSEQKHRSLSSCVLFDHVPSSENSPRQFWWHLLTWPVAAVFDLSPVFARLC